MTQPLTRPVLKVAADPAATEADAAQRHLWLARVLMAVGVLAGLVIAVNLGVLLWGQNEFSQPESVVAAQTMMLVRDGTFYNSLRDYPYTVNAYMPVFYLLDSVLIRVGIPAFVAGRLISFTALMGIFFVCWRLLMLYTKGNRYCAWIGTLLCASTSLLTSWGTVGQVDTLAVCLALTSFYQYSRYRFGNSSALLLAGLFAVLAVFTKQTMLAAPTAIFLCLLFERAWKTALVFGVSLAGVVLGGVLCWNWGTHGNFLLNTVFANINPFVWERFQQHWNYLAIGAGQLILVAAVCVRETWRGEGKALLTYLALAGAIFVVTAGKLGSDSNYQIETTILLALSACVGLHEMNYFGHLFKGSRTWITLLQLPLAIHLVLNFRISVPFLIGRVVKEQSFRQQIDGLKPLTPNEGRVVSTDLNAMARLRGRLDVEPLIYTILVNAGRVDPKPLQRDLAAGAIPTVMLYWDINKPFDHDPEIPNLPDAQLDEIRKHYKIVRHVPGPYLDGVYVYEPLKQGKPL